MTRPLRVGIAGLGTVGASVIRILDRQNEAVAKRCGRPVRDHGRLGPRQEQGPGLRSRRLSRGSTIRWSWPARPRWIAWSSWSAARTVQRWTTVRSGPRRSASTWSPPTRRCWPSTAWNSHGLPRRRACRSPSRPPSPAASRSSRPCARRCRATRISRLYGILNGTCNYILSRMELEGLTFARMPGGRAASRLCGGRPDLRRGGFRHRPQARHPDEPRLRHRDRRRGDLRGGHLLHHARSTSPWRRSSASASSFWASPSAPRPASSSAFTRPWCPEPPPSPR